jgi:FtsP/CotA-like multicopper oxidase with cupredoxin domain
MGMLARLAAVFAVVGLGAVDAGCGRAASGGPPSRWLSADMRTRTATLTLIAGFTAALEGFNFDGYGRGALVVSIPLGYRVRVVYRNNGVFPHSILVTPYTKKDLSSGWPLAFPGAASPDMTTGAARGAVQRFSFRVTKVGQFAIMCAVSGHEALGMWDVLRVTRGGRPTVTIHR